MNSLLVSDTAVEYVEDCPRDDVNADNFSGTPRGGARSSVV